MNEINIERKSWFLVPFLSIHYIEWIIQTNILFFQWISWLTLKIIKFLQVNKLSHIFPANSQHPSFFFLLKTHICYDLTFLISSNMYVLSVSQAIKLFQLWKFTCFFICYDWMLLNLSHSMYVTYGSRKFLLKKTYN